VIPLFGESTFSGTSTSTVRWRGDNYDANPFDDHFLAPQQRLDLVLQGESLRFDLRLDGFVPMYPLDGVLAGTPRDSSLFGRTCRRPNGVVAELQCYLKPLVVAGRLLLRKDWGDFTLELGDAYAVLGRG